MSFFDEFLKKVPADDQAVLNKYPELKASVEKLETDYNTYARYAGEWVDWQQQYWDAEAGMTKREKALQDELTAAQARINAGVGTGADRASVEAIRKELDEKVKSVQAQSLQAIEGMNMFYQSAAKHMLPHQQEFKENLDPQTLMKFMQDNRITDPDTAYDRMVAGRRAEAAAQAAKDLEAKHAADLQAAREDERKKVMQEHAMGPGGVLPTDNTGGIAGITARVDQPAKVSDEVRAKVQDAKLGDGSLAALGYELYRTGQLPVQ